jgi:type III pantothenate kinase
MKQVCLNIFGIKPFFIKNAQNIGLKIDPSMSELGADRIANAAAGYAKFGGPLIIIDLGTATTVCAISASGDYLGGAIAPGIGISTEALFQRTSLLSRIELTVPQSAIGKTTVTNMQSGIIFGFVGQVDEIVRRIQVELGQRAYVVATGGLSYLIADESSTIDEVVQELTLDGIRIIYEFNN